MVLADPLHRHEALAGFRHRYRHRAIVEIEHPRRVERVPVAADDGLVCDRQCLPTMVELADPYLLDDVAEVHVRLGADEVVHGHGFARQRRSGERRAKEGSGADLREIDHRESSCH
jgi:hypothetical protein